MDRFLVLGVCVSAASLETLRCHGRSELTRRDLHWPVDWCSREDAGKSEPETPDSFVAQTDTMTEKGK